MSYLGNKEVMAQNIQFFMDKNSVSRRKLSDDLSISYTTLTDWIKGKTYPRIDKIELLANYFHVSKSDLVEKRSDNSDILPIYNKLSPPRQKKVLECAEEELKDQEEETKVIGFPERKRIVKGRSTAAGTPIDGDVQDSEAETTVVDREEIPKNADEIITIAGDSMEPFLMKGEQAFIQYTPWVENGTPAVVSIEDVGVTCKYVYVEDQDVRLVSENDAYDDMIYPCEEVRIIGKIL